MRDEPADDTADVSSEDDSRRTTVTRRGAVRAISAVALAGGLPATAAAHSNEESSSSDEESSSSDEESSNGQENADDAETNADDAETNADSAALPDDGWSPDGDVEFEDLTDKSDDELLDAIPSDAVDRIESADVFAPLNVLEAQQNNDRPEPGENGLGTFTRDGDDVEYEVTINAADDLENVTQSHVHHASPGNSDNGLFTFLIDFAELDGDGDPADPPISTSGEFSESQILDGDPEVPVDDEEGDDDSDEAIDEYVDDFFANAAEYQMNVHTVDFQTEAIRGQLIEDDLDDLSREELIYTVLATNVDGL